MTSWFSPLITTTELEFSWWEFQEAQGVFNVEEFLSRVINNPKTADIIFDWFICEFNGCPAPQGFNSPVTPIVNEYEVYNGGPGRDSYYPGGGACAGQTPCSPNWGSWVQWEIHFFPGAPNANASSMQIFKNGVLFASWDGNLILGSDFNHGVYIQIGGSYTAQPWYTDAHNTSCAASVNSPNAHIASDVYITNFNSLPCPNQGPPNGKIPTFRRAFDDIIILKK